MAFKITDSCDCYSVTADIATRWTIVTPGVTFVSGGGVFGGGAIEIGGAATNTNVLTSRVNQIGAGNVIIGFYFKCSSNPTGTQTIFRDDGVSVTISLTNTGTLTFSNNTSLATSGAYTDGHWHWIECNAITGGVYIDNIAIGSFGSPGRSVSQAFFYSAVGVNYYIDDLIIYDATTGAPVSANFPLGPRQITVVRPNSDQSVAFGTIVGGDGVHHYASVDEVVPDGNTSYVQDGGASTQDLLGCNALGYTPVNISGAMVTVYFENPNGGSINLQGVCKSSSTTSAGATTPTPLSYQSYQWGFGVDPNTSAAWTAAGLNAAEFGYKNA